MYTKCRSQVTTFIRKYFFNFQVFQKLLAQPDTDNRMQLASEILMATKLFKSQDDIKMAARGFLQRLIISEMYRLNGLIKCEVTLLKAGTNSNDTATEDYGVQQVRNLLDLLLKTGKTQ